MVSVLNKIMAIFTATCMFFLGIAGFTGENGTGHQPQRIYKNVILFIGDGMGFNVVEATKKYKETDVSMETMPVISQSKTRSVSDEVTDSAAGGTALATGVKTFNSGVAVYPFIPTGYIYYPKSITEVAIENGKSAGVVTTDQTTGATPATFSSHTYKRKNEEQITRQQLSSDLTLVWGAAADEPMTQIDCNKYNKALITTATQMNALQPGSKSIGQFDFDSFSLALHDNDTPTLDEMTTKAIELLNADEDGFFLMVEAAHIDKFSHSNVMVGSTMHVVELSKAVQAALDFAAKDGNTLVVVTADHETGGITLNPDTGDYYYTTIAHTAANVPVYVSATDAGFVDGQAYKNCEVGTQLARVMGYDKSMFPVMHKIELN